MRFTGYTDPDDYHWQTLFEMLLDRKCWSFGISRNGWRFGFEYLWYDGPIFTWQAGPLQFALGHWYWYGEQP